MNIKKITLCTIILIVAIFSLSMVSAGWFDFLNKTPGIDVNGVAFNNSGYDGDIKDQNGTFYNYTYKKASFDKRHNNDSLFDNRSRTFIQVMVYSSDKDINLGENTILSAPHQKGSNFYPTETQHLENGTFEKKTINGKEGYLLRGHAYDSQNESFEFIYIDGKKYVDITTNNITALNGFFGDSIK